MWSQCPTIPSAWSRPDLRLGVPHPGIPALGEPHPGWWPSAQCPLPSTLGVTVGWRMLLTPSAAGASDLAAECTPALWFQEWERETGAGGEQDRPLGVSQTADPGPAPSDHRPSATSLLLRHLPRKVRGQKDRIKCCSGHNTVISDHILISTYVFLCKFQ